MGSRARRSVLIAIGCLLALFVAWFFSSQSAEHSSQESAPQAAKESIVPPTNLSKRVEIALTPPPAVGVKAPQPRSEPQPPASDEPTAEGMTKVECAITSDVQIPTMEAAVFEASPWGKNRWLLIDGRIDQGKLTFESSMLTRHGSVDIPGVGEYPLNWGNGGCTLVIHEPTYIVGRLLPPPPSPLDDLNVGGCGGSADEVEEDGSFTMSVAETSPCEIVVFAKGYRLARAAIVPLSGAEIVLDIEVPSYEAVLAREPRTIEPASLLPRPAEETP